MSVIYDVLTKTSRMTTTRDDFANGSLELLAENNAILAVFGLDAAGGTIATDEWSLVFDAATVAGLAAAGAGIQATKAVIKNVGATQTITGLSVGITGSGADVSVDNSNIAEGQNVTLTSAIIKHAA